MNQIFISLFTSRNEWTRFSFHFSLLEMSEPDFHFTFHFLNFQYPLLQGTGPPPSNPKKGWIYKPSRLKSIPPVHFCQALNYVATSFPSFSNPTKSIWAHGRIRWAHFDPFSVVAPHTKTEMQVSKNCGLHFDESSQFSVGTDIVSMSEPPETKDSKISGDRKILTLGYRFKFNFGS